MTAMVAAKVARAAGAAIMLVAITVGLELQVLTSLDTAVADVFPRHRDPAFPWLAHIGFSLGQTWVFPAASAVLTVILARRRRSWRPLLTVAAVWLAHSAVTGTVKMWAARQGPGSGQPDLHAVAGAMSYPSGHIANIMVFTAVIGALLTTLTGQPRWHARLLVVGITSSTICAASMIYLGYHWTTDAVAGFALGCLLRTGVPPVLTTALAALGAPVRSAPLLDQARPSAVANPADSEMANES